MGSQLSTFNRSASNARSPEHREGSTFLFGAKRGFALLITITLLAFLVVLLVGLASYMRVETAVAGNTQRQTQARQNALMALDVALGQLQKYAGPDQRVTATAEAFGGKSGSNHFTGVWSSDPTATATSATPLTWLVSGNELQGGTAPLSIRPNANFTTTDSVELVGTHTSGAARDVVAKLQPVTAVGLPGVAGSTQAVIGRYAWWVGDQGVKAPVALADPTAGATGTSNFNYLPYKGSPETLSRIRQQISLGAGAADASGNAVFEPRDTTGNPSNTTLAANVIAPNQLAFFKKTASGTVGLTTLQQNFHAWSPNNFAVLANTKLGGLRQDLSLFSPTVPSPLGTAYDAWTNFDHANGGYMESPVPGGSAPPAPDYSGDPLRRRYLFFPPNSDGSATFSVSPALSFFGISFSVREDSASPPQMEVAARCVVGLWNPYSAALVPEDLKIEVTGLPDVQVVDNAGGAFSLPLQTVMGSGPLVFSLPVPVDGVASDESSWLPGRVYDWAAVGNTAEPAGGNPMIAHHPDAIPPGGAQGIVRSTGSSHGTGPTIPAASDVTRICFTSARTVVHVRLLRAADNTELARYDSPQFPLLGNGSGTTPLKISNKFVDFAFVFRLPETDELPTNATEKWLSSTTRDPRSPFLSSSAFLSGPKGDDAAAYGGDNITSFVVSSPGRLLDRAGNSYSYDEDVPVFELPRSPILSVGELQHLQLVGARPFSIGNSWGAAATLNSIATGALFDRFFFSGLVTNLSPTGTQLLPNPLLKMLPRNPATGAAVTVSDLRSVPGAASSKFLLQGGAFNLNSISLPAWAAVLRSVRFAAPQTFGFLNASFSSGSSGDSKTSASFPGAHFFRFAQSAQETYEADDPIGGSTYAASTVDPATGPPNPTSTANTHLFRRGMKTLTAAQVVALAQKITDAIKDYQATNGPFRTLEEFLGPATSGSPSLIEQAVIDADLAGAQINVDANGNAIEFSSQFLTQGDIMTALAPVLFPRSDTFVIRTYGEAVNPTTGVTEGRAWCEAIVQRVPEYFDPSITTGDQAEIAPAALTSTLNQTFGRRFKIVSFRWLTRSDI